MKVTLYRTKRRINLTLDGLAKPNWNYSMHSPDFRAYRGAHTDVEFFVRDIDRKPVNLTGLSLIATLVDHRDSNTYGQIPMEVIDAPRALVRLRLSPTDIEKLPLGFLSYTISTVDDQGIIKLLYTDQYDQAKGFFEVMSGALPEPRKTITVLPENFTALTNQLTGTIWQSGSYPGNQQVNASGGIHTFAIYAENFSGKVWIQGNLDSNQSPDNDDWFNIPVDGKDYVWFDKFTGIEPINIEQNLFWVRFKFETRNETGKITKILFRN